MTDNGVNRNRQGNQVEPLAVEPIEFVDFLFHPPALYDTQTVRLTEILKKSTGTKSIGWTKDIDNISRANHVG